MNGVRSGDFQFAYFSYSANLRSWFHNFAISVRIFTLEPVKWTSRCEAQCGRERKKGRKREREMANHAEHFHLESIPQCSFLFCLLTLHWAVKLRVFRWYTVTKKWNRTVLHTTKLPSLLLLLSKYPTVPRQSIPTEESSQQEIWPQRPRCFAAAVAVHRRGKWQFRGTSVEGGGKSEGGWHLWGWQVSKGDISQGSNILTCDLTSNGRGLDTQKSRHSSNTVLLISCLFQRQQVKKL